MTSFFVLRRHIAMRVNIEPFGRMEIDDIEKLLGVEVGVDTLLAPPSSPGRRGRFNVARRRCPTLSGHGRCSGQ
jgi:hypothetical protein